jgi:hypothetical protein
MSPMLIIIIKKSTIKQLGKRDNARQRPHDITQFSKNIDSKHVIISIFNIDRHHDLIKVWIKEGSNAKKDGLITSKGRYSKLMGGRCS